MAIKTILIPFLNEASAGKMFSAALAFATHYRAHMRFVHLLQRPVPPGAYAYPFAAGYVQDSFTDLEAAAHKSAKDMEDLFSLLCEKHGVPVIEPGDHSDDKGATASWMFSEADIPYGYTGMSRLADVILLEKPEVEAPLYQLALVEEMLFQSARPVVLLGQNESLAAMAQTIVLGWNGSREAGLALSSAMPLLEQARLVDVVTVGKLHRDAEPPDRVVTYLKLHGIPAEVSHLTPKKNETPEAAFLDHANSVKADLAVLGAYSHNRWREIVMGGFTRHLLTEPSLPVLMTH